MNILEAFEAESLYTRDQWYLHEVTELNAEAGLIRAVTDTNQLGHVVAAQRPWPGQPQHIPGILMVQITGTLGNLHAVYALNLRMTEGWVGFGTHIHEASFRHLGEIGPPLELELRALRIKRFKGSVFVRYAYRFEQSGRLVYSSQQTAVWSQTPANTS